MTIENVFIDTSAFYALMDRSDSYHQSAGKLWADFLDKGYYLKTSNYVVVETLALLQNRLGFKPPISGPETSLALWRLFGLIKHYIIWHLKFGLALEEGN